MGRKRIVWKIFDFITIGLALGFISIPFMMNVLHPSKTQMEIVLEFYWCYIGALIAAEVLICITIIEDKRRKYNEKVNK